MKKERNVIEQKAVVVFDRDVTAAELNTLFVNDDFQWDIVINGNLNLENCDLFLKCGNMYVMGEITMDDNTITEIVGNLYVYNNIYCNYIKVNGSLYCFSYFTSMGVDVSEDLWVEGAIDANGEDIYVGGDLICNSYIESSDEIYVLNSLIVEGSIEASRIWIG